MNIHLEENALTPEQFLELRYAVGWNGAVQQIEKSLTNGLFNLLAKDGEQIVGMGRLIGDGVMYWYIQDLIVVPSYQGNGIGKLILNKLISYTCQHSLPNTIVTIGLMSARGKETFYQKFGFIERPNDVFGAGMVMNKTVC